MRQTDTEYQRVLNVLLEQVRRYDEGRHNEICLFSEQPLEYSRRYVKWLTDILYQKNWDWNYSLQQRTDHLREGIMELNKRVMHLEEGETSGDKTGGQGDPSADEHKIDLFLEHIRSEMVQAEGQEKKERLRLAVFTPLSPLKNGIADYMTVILLALKPYVEIDIYIDDGYAPDDPDILQSFAIYRHGKFHELHVCYDLILYELGNNPHHAYIVPYALQYPGVVELHDFRLEYLCDFLPPEYQKIARTESTCAKYPEGCGYNPLNLYLLKVARGVLVHSEFSRQAVFDEGMSIDVKKIEHFAKAILEQQETSHLIKKHRLEDCFLFSCFGFVNSAKRVEQVVISFSKIVQKYPNTKFKLLIVGEFTEDHLAKTKSLIRKYHLKKHVVMTGYVTLEEMYQYISLTDVCMNLRYPYGGESSGTLSRIMGMGKACVVNRVGTFDEMPDFCCHKIAYESDPEKEVDNITNAMSILFENGAYRKWIAGNAQTYVIEHLNLNHTIQLYHETFDSFYCKPGLDVDVERLMKKSSSFLAYNYFNDPQHAAKYFASKLYSLFYGGSSEEQQAIEQVSAKYEYLSHSANGGERKGKNDTMRKSTWRAD